MSTPTSGPVRPAEVGATFREDLHPTQRATLVSWLAFTGTFGAVRGITYSIRAGTGPFHNVSVGGEHLHHYLWGIALVSSVGALAVSGNESRRTHPAVAAAYGSGMALIVDEFALLLDLRDVYWAKEGRVSVDVGVGLIALSGSALASVPLWRRLRERRRRAAG